MRDAIRRALASPPPRGAVIVVAVGLVVTIAAIVLSRDPGGVGEDVSFLAERKLPDSPTVTLGDGGEQKIVDGVISTTADNDLGERLYKIEASLRARAGANSAIDSVRCQIRLPDGVHIGQSDGRRAAFPRPLADTADDAIKEGAAVEFETDDAAQAGLELRNAFFKYVIGGDPSISWPNLAEGQHVWLWRYEKPVPRTRDNFAVVLVADGGQTVPLACTVEASGQAAQERATVRTSVRLPRKA
jgi:hypothetical protein